MIGQKVSETFSPGSARMFLGSLDDSVARYPWNDILVDVDSLNRMLIYYAVFGPTLCTRIGGLIYNSKLIKILTGEQPSPLMSFAQSGFFQIQTRRSTINQSIEDRRQIRTNSTLDFISKYGWQPGTDLYRRFDEIDSLLQEGKGRLTYDADFVPEFKAICRKIIPEPSSPFGSVFNLWSHRFDEIHQSRSNFEITAQEILTSYADKSSAMHIINSINHYAYGIALRKATGSASIETKEITALQRLTRTHFGEEERTIDIEQMKELRANRTFHILGKNLKVPERLFSDPQLWKKLAAMLDPEGGPESSLFRMKKSQLHIAIREVIGSPNQQRADRELGEAARDYSNFLNDRFGTKSLSQTALRMRVFVRASVGASVGIATDHAMEAVFGEKLGSVPKLAVDLIVALGVDRAAQEVIRGVDHFLLTGEPAHEFESERLKQAFDGLSIRQIEADSTALT